jgi:hypothetical protein
MSIGDSSGCIILTYTHYSVIMAMIKCDGLIPQIFKMRQNWRTTTRNKLAISNYLRLSFRPISWILNGTRSAWVDNQDASRSSISLWQVHQTILGKTGVRTIEPPFWWRNHGQATTLPSCHSASSVGHHQPWGYKSCFWTAMWWQNKRCWLYAFRKNPGFASFWPKEVTKIHRRSWSHGQHAKPS